ncbi:hypothetical protein IBJ60_19135 [Nocardioides sp. zg-578]|uniref:Uncharacterized protein n=1 Tax=Nocardioides marmotae TaxID=2663857 RepID=A0A6I3JCE6_9ACTN|nr:hypothetical protein [Nocardioides marmotae]MCR6032099.1 hypothetical protein [Gordonia jinghuaiqii]MTB86435.1 hypothetical protein [Nocardioides marmotae]MTB95745.1 hypothetical protein [Nocardioides marmotae]QKE03670.1 hypothetical protein HPC71_18845 [Nocardioides marmotae]
MGTDPAVDSTEDASDNESYHGYSVDDETQPQSSGDSLVQGNPDISDPLDEGYSPPEKYSVAQGYGNTPLEEAMGETLDQRLQQEVPEPDPYEQAEVEAARGELNDDIRGGSEVGDQRAGRLVEPDEGAHTDVEKDMIAQDVGIDGAGAAAEEAAVHIVDEDEI